MAHAADENDLRHRRLRELVRLLQEEGSALVRDATRLARAEALQTKGALKTVAAMFSVAAVLALLALGALVTSLILALAIVMDGWAAALIVSAGLVLLAGVLIGAALGMIRRARRRAFQHTIGTLKETVTWARTLRESVTRSRPDASASAASSRRWPTG